QLVVRAPECHAGLLHGLGDLRGLLRAQAQRLLAQDVLSGLGGREDRGGVQMVGQADVDRVDICVLHQLVEVGVTGRAGLGLAAGQGLGVEVGSGGDFRAVGDGGVGVQMSGGDAAAAQDADADGGGNGGGGHGGS